MANTGNKKTLAIFANDPQKKASEAGKKRRGVGWRDDE